MKVPSAQIIDGYKLALENLTGSGFVRLKKLFESEQQTEDQLLEVLPPAQVLAVAFAIGSENEEGLKDDIPDAVYEYALALRRQVIAHIPNVVDQPVFQRALQKAVNSLSEGESEPDEGDQDEDEIRIQRDFNRVMGISLFPLLAGDVNALTPWIRINLRGVQDVLLLDTTATAGDIGFLARAFSEMMVDLFTYCQPLVAKGVIGMPFKESLVETISQLERDVESLKKLAPQLGLTLEAPIESPLPKSEIN